MPSLQQALTSTLTATAVAKAELEVKRLSLPERRKFDKAVAKLNANSLDRVKWLCEVANARSTVAKVEAAKKALLDIIGKHTRPELTEAKTLSCDEWALLSSFYTLHLDSDLAWSTAELVYTVCHELNAADNWANQVKRW